MADSNRPLYHFLPPSNWMNDPNGLIQWQGTYHLFYQYNPNAAHWGDIHWGHATSPDLVHWTHQPIALTPTPGGLDEGCFTGCAVNWDGQPTLVYTGWTPERETVCLATSRDGLLTWEKHPRNPVIAAPPPGLDLVGFRDPCVWREGEVWKMVLGSGIRGEGGAALLYASPNLLDWTYEGPLLTSQWIDKAPLATGDMWECPNFFRIGDRHLLFFSAMNIDPGDSLYPVYILGKYQDNRFTPEKVGWLDGGEVNCYAPQAFVDEAGRLILFGWAREGLTPEAQEVNGWAGVMTLPRQLELNPDGNLSIRPVPEVEKLRGEARVWENLQVALDETLLLQDFGGDCLELEVVYNLTESGLDGAVGLVVRRSPKGEEQTEIRCDLAGKRLVINTLRSSLRTDAQTGHFEIPFDLGEEKKLRLRIFLDKSILEAYANDRAVVTARIYPNREDSQGILLFAHQIPAQVEKLTAWRMNSAF